MSNIAYVLELQLNMNVTGSTHPSTPGPSATYSPLTATAGSLELTSTVTQETFSTAQITENITPASTHQSSSTVQTMEDLTPSVTHESTAQSTPLIPQQSTPPPPQSLVPAINSHPPPASDFQNKGELLPPCDVIEKYPRLRGECKMGELAAKLARESFFGKELMRRSTVMGHKEYPALPADRVNALKQTILSVCPDYHCNPHGFESVWRKCIDSLNHACSKLRK